VALGVTPTVVRVHYHSDQPFTDLAEACDFWEEYLGVSGPEVRGHLERFLAERLTRETSGWLAPYAKEALVIWWPVAGPGPERPPRGPGPRGYGTFTVTASLKVPTGWPAGVRAITRTW